MHRESPVCKTDRALSLYDLPHYPCKEIRILKDNPPVGKIVADLKIPHGMHILKINDYIIEIVKKVDSQPTVL